jgi:hypothetical protein
MAKVQECITCVLIVLVHRARAQSATSPGHVVIPDSATTMAINGFPACNSMPLMSVRISDSVTSIAQQAFRNCQSLTSVWIGDSVTACGQFAFGQCGSLQSVHLGAGVRGIGGPGPEERVFPNCLGFGLVLATGNDPRGDITCIPCRGVTTLMIPSIVVAIGSSAFFGCYDVRTVSLPNTVTFMGYWAFGNCPSMVSLDIPPSVRLLDRWSFDRTYNLTSVSIPLTTQFDGTTFVDSGCPLAMYSPGVTLCRCLTGSCAPTRPPRGIAVPLRARNLEASFFIIACCLLS